MDTKIKAIIAVEEAAQGEILENFKIYINRPIAIGEHPGITEEIRNFARKYSEHADVINGLKVMSERLKGWME